MIDSGCLNQNYVCLQVWSQEQINLIIPTNQSQLWVASRSEVIALMFKYFLYSTVANFALIFKSTSCKQTIKESGSLAES